MKKPNSIFQKLSIKYSVKVLITLLQKVNWQRTGMLNQVLAWAKASVCNWQQALHEWAKCWWMGTGATWMRAGAACTNASTQTRAHADEHEQGGHCMNEAEGTAWTRQALHDQVQVLKNEHWCYMSKCGQVQWLALDEWARCWRMGMGTTQWAMAAVVGSKMGMEICIVFPKQVPWVLVWS